MQLARSITITKSLTSGALFLAAGFLVLSLPAFAHGGFEHVIGNVVKLANNVLTVKTSTGNVDVKLDDKTEITKLKLKALVSDLVPGTRVVIDIPEGPEGSAPAKDRVAHAIKIGPAVEHAGHDGH
jgi:hypothetical protein